MRRLDCVLHRQQIVVPAQECLVGSKVWHPLYRCACLLLTEVVASGPQVAAATSEETASFVDRMGRLLLT